ncbi:hypothetical protein ACFL0L_05430, partial [Patescibacteria group bacterium]
GNGVLNEAGDFYCGNLGCAANCTSVNTAACIPGSCGDAQLQVACGEKCESSAQCNIADSPFGACTDTPIDCTACDCVYDLYCIGNIPGCSKAGALPGSDYCTFCSGTHCSDGVQNCGETGVDLGGACSDCTPPEEQCNSMPNPTLESQYCTPSGSWQDEPLTDPVEAVPGIWRWEGNCNLGANFCFNSKSCWVISGDAYCEGQGASPAQCTLNCYNEFAELYCLECDSCSDGIQNCDETGVDVGPSCGATCGNLVIEPGEDCETPPLDLNGKSCVTEGFSGGSLACNPVTCKFDTSGCSDCGNGTKDGTEECDGADLGGESCDSQGVSCNIGQQKCDVIGTIFGSYLCQGVTNLTCNANCTLNTSQCLGTWNLEVQTIPGPVDERWQGNCDLGQSCFTNIACEQWGPFNSSCVSLPRPPIDPFQCTPVCQAGWLDAYNNRCVATCNNGSIEPGEQCDGGDLNGQTCVGLGFDGGNLSCDGVTCQYDTTQCFGCGDGVKNGAEQCDGADFGTETCISQGFDGGSLICTASCTIDTTNCTEDLCGNSNIDPGEDCDGANLNGQTCATRGYIGGPLSCNADCTFNETLCTGQTCNNGTKEGTEQCDQNDFGGETCITLGYDSGTLLCNADCTYNTNSCSDCGNGVQEIGEQCDGGDLAGHSCISQGFDGGSLTCNASCTFNTTQCFGCGDGDIDPGEECDGSNLNFETCQTKGWDDGVLACNVDCTFNENACYDCDGASCPNGCCDVNGTCQPYAAQDWEMCETGGAACGVCESPGQSCTNGVCTDPPHMFKIVHWYQNEGKLLNSLDPLVYRENTGSGGGLATVCSQEPCGAFEDMPYVGVYEAGQYWHENDYTYIYNMPPSGRILYFISQTEGARRFGTNACSENVQIFDNAGNLMWQMNDPWGLIRSTPIFSYDHWLVFELSLNSSGQPVFNSCEYRDMPPTIRKGGGINKGEDCDGDFVYEGKWGTLTDELPVGDYSRHDMLHCPYYVLEEGGQCQELPGGEEEWECASQTCADNNPLPAVVDIECLDPSSLGHCSGLTFCASHQNCCSTQPYCTSFWRGPNPTCFYSADPCITNADCPDIDLDGDGIGEIIDTCGNGFCSSTPANIDGQCITDYDCAEGLTCINNECD